MQLDHATRPDKSFRGSRRHRLKDATAALHRDVEKVIAERAHFDSVPGYQAWLLGSLIFHRHFAGVLEGEDIAGLAPQRVFHDRVGLLERDLADLGLMPTARSGLNGPAPKDFAETLGVLYVTEGASLGARVLVARARKLGMDRRFGARLLTAQAESRDLWLRVVDELNDATMPLDAEQRLLAASLQTFSFAATCYGQQP